MPDALNSSDQTPGQTQAQAPDAERLAQDIERLESVVAEWDESYRDTALALETAVEAFHQAGLRALIAALKDDPAAAMALRSAAQQPQVYAMLRRLEILKPSMLEQVMAGLDSIRPSLQEHGGDVELVKISPPDRVSIRLTGACDGCGSSKVTLTEGVEKSLRSHCDWLVHIDDVSERKKAPVKPGESQPIKFVSPFAAASK